MENSPNQTVLTSSDSSDGIAPEQSLPTPHFDELSIQSARPAVPLAQIQTRRFWPLALVLMCGSILIGGVMGIALSRYENRADQISNAPAGVAQEATSQQQSYEPISQSVAEQDEKANDAGSSASKGNAEATHAAPPRENSTVGGEPISDTQGADARATLHGALDEWIAATNARDIKRQMDFYNQTVKAFYLTRNVPREAVRAEKSRVFGRANVIDIRASAPGIRLSPDGRTATMRFRKKYAIEGGGEDRRGEVVQELHWRRTGDGWKIVSERDLRVIN
jgi:ketosteroid isomerase-like protein